MKKQSARAGAVSRRTFMKSSAGVGVVLASGLAAPNVMAETAPIKLGNINTYTGGLSYAGEANFNAMSLYFDSINWTVAGRKIELIKEDDQFNPQIGLQKAKKLVESDNVDLVLGIQASNVALAVLNYMKQQKAFYVVTGAGTDAITWDRYPYLFRTSISTYQLSVPMADYVYDNLGKEIVLTASDYAGGHDVMNQFKGPYVAKGGKVLKEFWPPLGTADFSAYLTDIKSINPPVTYDFMPGADAARFVQQYSEFGLKEKMPLTGFTMIDSQTASAVGKSAVGVISALTYTDTVDNHSFQGEVQICAGSVRRLRLCRRQGALRSAASDRRRCVGQGQACGRDEQGRVQCAARPVPHGSRHAQPDSEHLYRAGDREGRRHFHQDHLHQQGRSGPRKEDLLTA
jgi:branched-chain amino acid transport system substrate-binding protein